MLNIQHLTKTYGDKKAVDDLSLHIAPGEIYGFIGHNGAGKTTTLRAVAGVISYTEGIIRVDGKELHQLTRSSLRRAYAMVLQDTWVFQGTIFENIAYGKEGATREEVAAVYRELKTRRWHAGDLQPLCARMGCTGKTLVALTALRQVGLVEVAGQGGASYLELVRVSGKKNLADAPILKCLEENLEET